MPLTVRERLALTASMKRKDSAQKEALEVDSEHNEPSNSDSNDFLENIIPITRSDLPPEGRDTLVAPRKAGSSGSGLLDETHGEGGGDRADFKPTRDEILAIARSYVVRIMNFDLDFFYYGQSGNSSYAFSRLDRIADVIGGAAVQEVINDVREQQRRRMGEKHWRIFTEGTEKEFYAIADGVHQDELAARCSICERYSDGLKFGESNVFWCEADRIYWCLAVGEFSSARTPAGVTLEDQQREWDRIGLSKFKRVEPRHLKPSRVES